MARAKALVTERSYVAAADATGDTLTITVSDGSAAVPDLIRLLHENKVEVSGLSVASPTLDDVFLSYTGRSIRSEDAAEDESGRALRPWLGLSRR